MTEKKDLMAIKENSLIFFPAVRMMITTITEAETEQTRQQPRGNNALSLDVVMV